MSLSESDWRNGLPELVQSYVAEWDLKLGEPYTGGTASYVAPARTADGCDAVLKLSLPHREARGEATALQLWAGHGAVHLYRHNAEHYALLIERCDPGVLLTDADLPAESRLTIAAELLSGLWKVGVPPDSGLERVADVTEEWADLVEERMRRLSPPYDPGLVQRGAELLRTLPTTTDREVVVHGDFNPGNILSSRREPWLVIDAKPMIGDPGYDLCPLLMQIDDPFAYADPVPILRTRVDLVAGILDVPSDRLLAWCMARMVESSLWYADQAGVEPDGTELSKAAVIADMLDGVR